MRRRRGGGATKVWRRNDEEDKSTRERERERERERKRERERDGITCNVTVHAYSNVLDMYVRLFKSVLNHLSIPSLLLSFLHISLLL